MSCGQHEGKHAQLHFTEIKHAVCMSFVSAQTWCYVCDDELHDIDGEELTAAILPIRTAIVQQRNLRIKSSQSQQPQQDRRDSSRLSTRGQSHPSRQSFPYSMAINSYAPTAGLTGLHNLGNTCFLAASLQALSHVPPLALYFTECALAGRQAVDGTMPVALQGFLRSSWLTMHASGVVDTGRLPSIAPSSVLRALCRANAIFEVDTGVAAFFCFHIVFSVCMDPPSLQGYAQQDAHEALRTIINEIHERSLLDVPLGLGSGSRNTHCSSRASCDTIGGAPAHGGVPLAVSQSSSNPLYVRGRGTESEVATSSSRNPMRVVPASKSSGCDSSAPGGSKRRREHSSNRIVSRVGVGPEISGDRDSDDDSEKAGTREEPSGYQIPADRNWLLHGPYTGTETVQRSIATDLFQGLLCSLVRCR